MKKVNLLICALWSLASFAQISLMQAPNLPELEISKRYHPRANAPAPSNAFYARDFANGIPASFTNQLFDSSGNLVTNGGWEFRGPNTNPSNSIGSRGGQSGSKTPLQSLTASNGFVIFDSDYLDDAGLTNNAGNGSTPARHVGVLKTDTIDCTGHPWVELKFNSSLRLLDSRCRLAISTNGGQSFPDTLDLYAELGANVALSRDAQSTLNLSTYIGNSAQVVLAFVFDGRGRGGYYWMIDDLELRDLPKNELRFTSAGAAAAHDIIYVSRGSNYPKQGHMEWLGLKPLFFDSNLWNYGAQAQTNVQFRVEIYHNNSLSHTKTAPVQALLAAGDTLDYTQLTTTAWNPQDTGVFTLVYTLSSDSIPASLAPRDSFRLFVTHGDILNLPPSVVGLDNGVMDNSIGTNILGDDGGAIAIQVNLKPNPNTFQYVPHIMGFELGFSDLTVDGGDILFELYDTANFDLQTGFSGSPLFSQPFLISPGSSGKTIRFTHTPFPLDTNAKTQPIAVIRLFSNSGSNPIYIRNDQSLSSGNPQHAVFYQADQQRFYTGIANSKTFNKPWFRLLVNHSHFDPANPVGLNEAATEKLQLYPNPATRACTVQVENGGFYTMRLFDTSGRELLNRAVEFDRLGKYYLDLSTIPVGAYFLQLEGISSTLRSPIILK